MNTTEGERFWRCDDCEHLNSDDGNELHHGDVVICTGCGEMAMVIREGELEALKND